MAEKFQKPDLEFDQKETLFGFLDKVYDLKDDQLRDYDPNDYITLHTGYHYMFPDLDSQTEIQFLLSRIIPDQDVREWVITYLASSLLGMNMGKVVFFVGDGRNGKGVINSIHRLAIKHIYQAESKYKSVEHSTI